MLLKLKVTLSALSLFLKLFNLGRLLLEAVRCVQVSLFSTGHWSGIPAGK